MSDAPCPILIAAGGTGGHVFPALAVADALCALDPAVEVRFVGTPHGLENRLVPAHGYALERIDVRFLKGTRPLELLKRVLLLPRSAWQTARLLRRTRPRLVLGAGGYVSGPVVGMAALLRIPTAILEQNAIPGLTNRLLARVVGRIYPSFAGTEGAYPAGKARVFGNPIRPMADAAPDRPRQAGCAHLLIVGGSQGARSLNEQMPRVLAALAGRARLCVRHQSGHGRDAPVRAAYEGFGGQVEVSEFIGDMAGAYRWADLVVCRAGATTVAELAAAGKPAVLVPFPHAAHNHQEKNAQAMVEAGAARMVLDRALAEEDGGEGGAAMQALLGALLEDTAARDAMAAAARRVARPDAAAAVARDCLARIGRPVAGERGA